MRSTAAVVVLAGCAPEATAACLAYIDAANACLASVAEAEGVVLDALDPDRLCAEPVSPRVWRCREQAYDAAPCAGADEIPALHAAVSACPAP